MTTFNVSTKFRVMEMLQNMFSEEIIVKLHTTTSERK